ncbi:MAG: hypothetical protein KC492_38255 [Myxococcales bacterium]|nr:hypothetical protein [Myxococcales bacterium]
MHTRLTSRILTRFSFLSLSMTALACGRPCEQGPGQRSDFAHTLPIDISQDTVCSAHADDISLEFWGGEEAQQKRELQIRLAFVSAGYTELRTSKTGKLTSTTYSNEKHAVLVSLSPDESKSVRKATELNIWVTPKRQPTE